MSQSPIVDTADGLVRLMEALVRLAPIKDTYGNERVTDASLRHYASRRGHELRLTRLRSLELIERFRVDDLGAEEALRCFQTQLTPAPSPTHAIRDPAPTRLSLSAATSRPTPALVRATDTLQALIEAGVAARNIELKVPGVSERQTRDGTRFLPSLRSLRRREGRSMTTGEIMTTSIARTAGADVVAIVQDPSSTGINVEREWALRLQMPIYEFVFTDQPHPHQDGPARIHTIQVDVAHPEHAVRSFFEHWDRRTWEAADAVAFRHAIERKNRALRDELSAAWDAREGEHRQMAWFTGMSEAYINGILGSGRALDLASLFQLEALGFCLHVPVAGRSANGGSPALSEIDALVATPEAAALPHRLLVHSVFHAAQQLRVVNGANFRLTSEEASEAMRRAVADCRDQLD